MASTKLSCRPKTGLAQDRLLCPIRPPIDPDKFNQIAYLEMAWVLDSALVKMYHQRTHTGNLPMFFFRRQPQTLSKLTCGSSKKPMRPPNAVICLCVTTVLVGIQARLR